MNENVSEHDAMVEDFWRGWMTTGPPKSATRMQHFYRILPAQHRCKFCYAPFDGASGILVRNIWKTFPSRFNPTYCNLCDKMANNFQGGAVVPITMLFADMRGSTTLAEKIDAKEFSALVNRFYVTASHILSHADGLIEKLAGDEVAAMFANGPTGQAYHEKAILTAIELLRATGYGDPQGPWVQIGIGIHSGETFVGSVGSPEGTWQVAALGDVPNTAARLTSAAAAGEILVSADTLAATEIETEGLEMRELALKGRSEAICAYVMTV